MPSFLKSESTRFFRYAYVVVILSMLIAVLFAFYAEYRAIKISNLIYIQSLERAGSEIHLSDGLTPSTSYLNAYIILFLGVILSLAFSLIYLYVSNRYYQTLKQLRAEKIFTEYIVKENPAIIVALSPFGITRFVNQRLCDLSGYDKKEFVGEYWWNFFSRHDDEDTIQAIIRYFEQGGEINEYETIIETKSGEKRTISWNSLNRYEDTDLEEIILFGIDVTERNEFQGKLVQTNATLQEALSENKLLMQAIESSGLGITMADANEEDIPLIYVNKAFEDLTGYTREEVYGKNCRFLQGPGTDPDNVAEIRKGIKEARSTSVEILNYKKDGTPFWNVFNVSPVFGEDGKLQTFIGIQQDVTQRKEYEQELMQARAEAERANKAKSEFLAGMSHEIRTPMNGIIGTSELMADTDLSKKQRDYLDILRSSGKTLLSIINEILDYSKIEAGKLEIEKAPLNLRTIIEEQISLLQPLADEKELGYSLHYDPDVPEFIIGDATRIKQVLTNLISNAIKFTEKGEVVVRVKLEKETDGAFIKFLVEDSGIGISKNHQSRIFGVFEQVIEDRKAAKVSGTGLGLAISKELARMMGGEIAVESKKGKGSKFWFTIPADEASEEDCVNAGSGEDNISWQDHQFTGNILVVEDVPTNQFVIMDTLENAGLDVDLAANGKEAIHMLQNNQYDMVFMDCNMPVMDGFEATAKIREKGYKDIPIVALTANALRGDREKCLAAGMNDFISKPIEKTRVLDVLTRFILAQERE